MMTLMMDRSGQYIYVTGAYIYAARMHKVPGMKFDYKRKIWWNRRAAIYDFDREFHGEVYYKTPLWVIENRPAPDYSELYEVDPSIVLPEMKVPLYGYQDFGARFMIERVSRYGFVINADGVGIGKTAQAIAVMQWYAVHKGMTHFLIVCKKSIKYQWAEEIRKFSTIFDRYEIYYTLDTKSKRDRIYREAAAHDFSILITNYHNFLNDSENIDNFGADFCVIDEAHSVKARKGVLNGNISKVIKGTPTVFLTGTPVMSMPEDIFGIVQMADPSYFGEWSEFKNRYLVVTNKFGYFFVAGVKHLDELHKKVQNIVIRRTEYEVSVQMPEVTLHNIKVQPSKIQNDLINEIYDRKKEIQDEYTYYDKRIELDGNDAIAIEGRQKAADKLKSFIAAQQTIATDPVIFRISTSKFAKNIADVLPERLSPSSKTEAVVDLVSDITDSGEKAILFSKSVMTCRYYAQILKKKKISVLMYTGEEDDVTRIENIKTFRSSDDHNILIGSDAMAEGLNLAEARHVINIDLPDTYAIFMQRFGRVRRVSSEFDNVIVHNILTVGTVDENKLKKLMENKNLDGALVSADEAQRKALIAAQNA